jgi:hypothetical protein
MRSAFPELPLARRAILKRPHFQPGIPGAVVRIAPASPKKRAEQDARP